MGTKNYLKCIEGIPAQPFEWTLDPAYIPVVEGVTWEPFDLDVMGPKEVGAALVDGKVVLDQARRNARNADKAKATARIDAIALVKTNALGKPGWGNMTVAERKVAMGVIPTDEDLGL